MSRDDSSRRFPTKTVLWGLSGLFYALFVRPQLARWGARLGEPLRRLPGDDLIPAPNWQTTRAVDIDAPAEAVWPWLAQMGRARTGWYGLDLVDNNGIPSASYIRKDLTPPQPGMEMDQGLQVLGVEGNRYLLIGGYDLPNVLGTSFDMSALYMLERKPDGSTRLLVRVRAYAYGLLGWLLRFAVEPVDMFIARRQMLGIKSRSETMSHLRIAAPLEHEISLN